MKYFYSFLIFFLFAGITQAQWVQKNSSVVLERHHPVTFTLDNTVYLLTGTTIQSQPDGTNDFFRYDDENDSWIQLEDFPGGARSYAYADTYNGKAYFGFGSNDFETFYDDLWEYDPVTEEWTELASCGCGGRAHPAFVAHQGKIYMGFGQNPFDRNDWWEYDIENDEWTQRDNIPGPGRHHPYHFAAGDHVYAGFGHSGGNYFADWYQYDPETQEWTRMQDHPAGPRVAGQEFSHNGVGYIISGDGSDHQNLQDGEFWRYEHEEDSWTRLPDHPTSLSFGRVGRWAPGVFTLNDHVYFFGGVSRDANILFNDMYSFELDPPVNTTDEFVTNDLSVYPNPAANILRIDSDLELNQNLRFQIYNAQGVEVFNGKAEAMQIDVSGFSSGIYTIHTVLDSGERYRGRFAVLH